MASISKPCLVVFWSLAKFQSWWDKECFSIESNVWLQSTQKTQPKTVIWMPFCGPRQPISKTITYWVLGTVCLKVVYQQHVYQFINACYQNDKIDSNCNCKYVLLLATYCYEHIFVLLLAVKTALRTSRVLKHSHSNHAFLAHQSLLCMHKIAGWIPILLGKFLTSGDTKLYD